MATVTPWLSSVLSPALGCSLRRAPWPALRAYLVNVGIEHDPRAAAHEVAPDLLMGEGVPTEIQPGELDRPDADRGAEVVEAMSRADVGQSCAIRRGQAISVDNLFGTDWMLRALAQRPDGTGGLLFKAPKPDQDRRADLPTIGPQTVELAAQAGLSGIVLEAGGVIVLSQDEVIETCNRLGLFLWLRPAA